MRVVTYDIFPVWESRRISSNIFCRRSECLYFSLCFSHNSLRSSVCVNNYGDTTCRFWGAGVETVSHVLIDCHGIDQDSLRRVCVANDIAYSLSNILSSPVLKVPVERLLYRLFFNN